MKKFIIVLAILGLMMFPALALAEGETIPETTEYVYEYPAIEITPEPTQAPIEETPTPTEEIKDIEVIEPVANASSINPATSSSIPYHYEYDDTTLIGALAAFLGIEQGEATPQNLGEAIPYILRVLLIVGVLWFIFAMIRGFTGNVFGKARNGGR